MSVAVYLNGETDVSAFVKNVTLSGHVSKFNREITVEFHTTIDGRTPEIYVDEGDQLTYRYNGKLRFIGIVFDMEITSDGSLRAVAYDSNVYLTKSKDTRIFTNKKASDIIKILAQDFEIPLGDIEDTGYVIPYLKLPNKSLSDMVKVALKRTRQQTGKRFFISNKAGRLTLTSVAKPQKYFVFKDGSNLISAKYSRSIEDMITQVRVIGGPKGKETSVIVKDDTKRKQYGVIQALEILDEKATASQVKQRASTILKESSQVAESLSVEVLGIPEVDVGSAVYVINEMTQTNGAYFVESVSHKYSSAMHTMSLTLTRTFELPDIEISSDMITREVAKKKKAEKKSTKTTKKEATKK